MSRENYVFIRMFANDEDFDGDLRPYYPVYEIKEEGGVSWSLTRDFREAKTFKSVDLAKRIVRNVAEFRSRIDRAWGFQIIRITEEILDTNIDFEDEDVLQEEAA